MLRIHYAFREAKSAYEDLTILSQNTADMNLSHSNSDFENNEHDEISDDTNDARNDNYLPGTTRNI